jgi:hypothetical protein
MITHSSDQITVSILGAKQMEVFCSALFLALH